MRTLVWCLGLLVVACGSREVAAPAPLELEGAYSADVVADGTVRTFELVAAETELPLLDGSPLRVWAYNGQVPGPTLRVRLGDTVRARFTNRLPQSTTIHWHGVRVPNRMDGVPSAATPAIAPGETFTYEFTPKDAGTFWFHPHIRSSEQVERGLYGVLVVEDRVPPPYARDEIWVLDDWLLGRDGQLVPRFNTPHDLSHDGRWGNVVTVNGRTDTTLHVGAGERIRLRLLNASNGRIYVPDFGDAKVDIIAVDGLYARQPIPLERFELAPGNRLDLEITSTGNASRVITVQDRFSASRPHRLAELQLDGGEATATFPSPARARVPSWTRGLTMPIAKELKLDARRGGPLGIEWTINGRAFAGHDHPHESFALARGQWARLRFTNVSARLHPIHLHGMFFKVIGRDELPVDEPFFRDTVLVHGRETVDIAVVPLDEGSWMLHCHILEHAEAGMMTMIDVGEPPARPAFQAPLLSGGSFDTASLPERRPMLLIFWSTWCDPCVAQLPHLTQLHAEYGDRVDVVSVAVDDAGDVPLLRTLVAKHGVRYPVALDLDGAQILPRFSASTGLPLIVVLDAHGRVQFTQRTYKPGDERALREAVARVASDAMPSHVR